MNKKLKIFFLFLIILLAFYWFKENYYILYPLLDLKPFHFIIFSFITIINIILGAYAFFLILKIEKINLKPIEWLGLNIFNRLGNYLFFKGGSIIRGMYLKKKYNLPYKNYIFLFFISSLVNTCVGFFIFSLVIIFKTIIGTDINIYLLIFSVLILIFIVLLYFLISNGLKKVTKINIINKLAKAQELILKNKIIIIKAFFLICLSNTLLALKLFFIYNLLFTNISFSSALLVSSASLMSFVLAITPAGKGPWCQ